MLSACGRVLRDQDPDRYFCCLFAQSEHREALFVLHAFDHEIERIRLHANDLMLRQLRLQWWRDSLADLGSAAGKGHPVLEGLHSLTDRFGLTVRSMQALLDAREPELLNEPIDGLHCLTDRIRSVETALLPTFLRILERTEPATQRLAGEVAVAWGLIRVLRETPVLLRDGCFVLPREFGIGDSGLDEVRGHPALRTTVLSVVGQAHECLSSAQAELEGRIRPLAPMLLPARLARLYISRLERAGWDPFDPDVNAPMPLKVWSLWLASFRRHL